MSGSREKCASQHALFNTASPYLIFSAIVGCLFACASCTPRFFEFGISGKKLLCVPASVVPRFNRGTTRSSIFIKPKYYPYAILSFQFDEPEVLKAIPTFHVNQLYGEDAPSNTIYGAVSLISGAEARLNYGRSPQADAIWKRSDSCAAPLITAVAGSSDYLGQCGPNSVLHILFDRDPGGTAISDVYSAVVGRCVRLVGEHGKVVESCTRTIIVRTYRVDYNFDVVNAAVVAQMDSFLHSKIASWGSLCAKSREGAKLAS